MIYVFAYPSLEKAEPQAWERFCRGEIPYPLARRSASAADESSAATLPQEGRAKDQSTEARCLVIQLDDRSGGSVEPISIPLDEKGYLIRTEFTLPAFDPPSNVIDVRQILARRFLKRHFEWLPEPVLIDAALSRCVAAEP